LESNRTAPKSVTYRSIVRKYPERERAQILRDLIAATPGEEGKWFAAAKEAGQLEMASVAVLLIYSAGHQLRSRGSRAAIALAD
jgi:hypothetical protein